MFLIEISESFDESASNDGGSESEGDGGAGAEQGRSGGEALAERGRSGGDDGIYEKPRGLVYARPRGFLRKQTE